MPTIPVGDLLEQTFGKLSKTEKEELATVLSSSLVKKYSSRLLSTNLLDPREAESALREQGKYTGALEFLELINHVLDEHTGEDND
jgi:hypothetical protein